MPTDTGWNDPCFKLRQVGLWITLENELKFEFAVEICCLC